MFGRCGHYPYVGRRGRVVNLELDRKLALLIRSSLSLNREAKSV